MFKEQQRLRLLGLPVFDNIEDLAALLHIDPGRLTILSTYAQRFYRSYRIRKRTGGWRQINQPCRELKAVQAWILRNILDKLSPSQHATAYLAGKRLSDNVTPHSGNRYFLSVDLEDFFPSIQSWKIQRLFELVGYAPHTAALLSNLCTYFRSLPQGGVTSPALSNLVALKMDRRVSGLVSRRNIVFTRYADDMTFSSNNRVALIKALPSIRHILRREGFNINEAKTRFLGPRSQCRITGLIKDSSEPRFGIGREKKIRMRAIMHNLISGRKTDSKYPSENAIEGWLNFLKGVDEKSHSQMLQYWNQLRKKYSSIHPRTGSSAP
jgi:retron-type reverse transcriptase